MLATREGELLSGTSPTSCFYDNSLWGSSRYATVELFSLSVERLALVALTDCWLIINRVIAVTECRQ